MSDKVFSNVNILDLSEGIAGPYCTRLLAAFGAQVTKVEKPQIGDISRAMGPFPNNEYNLEKSGTFYYLNTDKKSVTLNLKSQRGQEICQKLLKESDVLVESFAPGGLAKSGLTKRVLKEINPYLIVTSISAFGKTGPYRNYRSNNLIASALGGTMYVNRPGTKPTRRPAIQGGFQAEYSTGVLSYIATVAALIGRSKNDKGISIDLSMMDSVATTLMGQVTEYSYLGLSRRTNPFPIHGYPIGNSVPCKDGWISLIPGIGGAPNLPFLIEKPELQDDRLFTETHARMAEPEKFDALLLPWLKEHDKWEVAKAAQELRLAITPVLSPGELFDDPQLRAREFFATAEHPELGKVTVPGLPAKLSATPGQVGRAPLLGEHNLAVYTKCGLTRLEIKQLQKDEII
jgi:crotonobetainyl-CoA:carnitine CoA-transferase CaiB-like acyl-CoA transferase